MDPTKLPFPTHNAPGCFSFTTYFNTCLQTLACVRGKCALNRKDIALPRCSLVTVPTCRSRRGTAELRPTVSCFLSEWDLWLLQQITGTEVVAGSQCTRSVPLPLLVNSLAGALPWPFPDMPPRAAVVQMGGAATATSTSSTKPNLADAGPLMGEGYHPHCRYL